MKKLIALFMVAVLCLSTLAGCGGDTDEKTTPAETENTQGTGDGEETTEAPPVEINYPLEDAVPLSWWVGSGPTEAGDDSEGSFFHEGLERMTGVDIEWRFVKVGGSTQTDYNLLLLDKELPDIMMGTVIDPEDLYQQDMIWDLTDYIPQYAPDYWAYLNENDLLKDVKSLDGRLLTVNSFGQKDLATTRGMLIRQDWLDECGLEMPVTLAEFENVLVKFKERYGAVLYGTKTGFLLNMWGITSGIGAMGGLEGLNFYVDENGKIQCAQAQDEWKELMRTLERWYSQDLIDPDYGNRKVKTALADALDGKTGIFLSNDAQGQQVLDAFADDPNANWVPMHYLVPAEGEAATSVHMRLPVQTDLIVITKSATEEEMITALKLLNYGFTKDGHHFWNFGEENVAFYYDENGKEQWTDVILNDPDGVAKATEKYIGAYGAGPCEVDSWQKEIRSGAEMTAVLRVWEDNDPSFKQYIVPQLKYSTDEADELSDVQTRIETYAQPMMQKLMVGEEPIEKLDEFVTELYNLGLGKVLEIMQTAYDRYLTN